jgi:hypothetical protein
VGECAGDYNDEAEESMLFSRQRGFICGPYPELFQGVTRILAWASFPEPKPGAEENIPLTTFVATGYIRFRVIRAVFR